MGVRLVLLAQGVEGGHRRAGGRRRTRTRRGRPGSRQPTSRSCSPLILVRNSSAFALALVSIEARRRSARFFGASACLRPLALRSAAMASRYWPALACFSAKSTRTFGVVGGHGLEPADRLADREQHEHVAGRVAGEQAEARPAVFAEEVGGVTAARAEVEVRVILAVDDRQRHRSLRGPQGLVLEDVGLALDHHLARDGERPGDLLGEVHQHDVGEIAPLRMPADEVAPDRIDLPQIVQGLGHQCRALAVGAGKARRCSGP